MNDQKITLDSKSHRYKDENNYLIIEDNPIMKAGVFDYLGKHINAPEPERKYKVYRPFEEIEKMKDQLSGMPLVYQHKWINPKNENTIAGSIGGEITSANPYLKGRLTVFNDEAIKGIEDGSCQELSMGYQANYYPESGEFNGEHYDYIQRDLQANHLALVPKGRSGKDLRVLDEAGGLEEMIEQHSPIQTLDEDKRHLIDEITAIAEKPESDFKGGGDEKARTIIKLAEKLAYKPSEGESKTDDEEEDEKKEFVEKKETKKEVKEEETEDGSPADLKKALQEFVRAANKFLSEEEGEEAHQTKDACGTRTHDEAIKTQDEIFKKISESTRAYEAVKPYTGMFNIYTTDGIMSEEDIYKYACHVINYQGQIGNYKTAFNAYLAGKGASTKSPTFDSASCTVTKKLAELTSNIK